MTTAVDSSVLLDVLLDNPRYRVASQKALSVAIAEGSLIIGEVVLAEITPVLPSTQWEELLQDWQMAFIPSSAQSAALAGSMFAKYRASGGKRERVIADFLIGAHAEIHADRLLTRDRGYYRSYFQKLNVWEP